MINKEELKAIRRQFDQISLKRNMILERIENEKESLSESITEYENCLKARSIVQIVAKDTQNKVSVHIGNLVSLALSSVFPDPYTFSIRFTERRNTTEADLIFSKGENEIDDPLSMLGGGICDTSSFSLRVALWSLNKTRPVFILDEPDKYLHSEIYQEKFSEMVKQISEKLGLQFIIVTDQQGIKAYADRIINVKKEKNISVIEYEK